MNFWLTTHWPPRVDSPDDLPEGVHIPDKRQRAGLDMAPGDLLLIYQTKTGESEVVLNAEGQEKIIRRKRGKEGIVVIARITGVLEANVNKEPTRYANGREIWWRWHAPTEPVVSDGFVHRIEVNRVLGHKEGNVFHGYGAAKSGLKKITKEQFDELVTIFKSNRRSSPLAYKAKQGKPYRKTHDGSVEESHAHKKLKEYVALHPSKVFNEDGVSCIKMEYPFPTADKADIILMDKFGRLIGVEIEVDVGTDEIVGLLQAVKYRFMVPIMEGRKLLETRAALIAYTISDEIKQLCSEYDVQWFEVDRSIVLDSH